MKLTLFNASNTDIIFKLYDSTYKIIPQSSYSVDCNKDAIDIQLLPYGNSYLKRVGKTVVGYHLYVETSYRIVEDNTSCYITLNVIGIEGDHYEYYLRVVPSSDTARINLNEYSIPDQQNIMESIISNYNQRHIRNVQNRKKRKKHNFFSEIILDTIYSVLPIMIIFRFFTNNQISKTVMIILMFAIWIIVLLIMQLIYKLYDIIILNKFDKVQNTTKNDSFDIMSIFESSYINSITSDTKRYQNKK